MSVFVPAEVESLRPWVDAGVLGAPEVHSAAVVARHLGGGGGALWADERVVLGFALAVWAPLHGHACIDLATVARTVADALRDCPADETDSAPAPSPLPWPEPTAWRNALRASSAVRVAGRLDDAPVLDDRPLVLHGTRLFTQRQWVDEGIVALSLRRSAALAPLPISPEASKVLDALGALGPA